MAVMMFEQETVVMFEDEVVDLQQETPATDRKSSAFAVEDDGVDWCAWWADYAARLE